MKVCDAVSELASELARSHHGANFKLQNSNLFYWLTWVPVVKHRDVTPEVYSLLCELAAGGHPALGAPGAPQWVVAVLADAFLRDAVPEVSVVFSQMVALVRQTQTNAELFNSCLMQLSNEHKEALQQAISKVT